MNVYDFDHTIYCGDSSVDFMFFHFGKHPLLWIFFPLQLLIGAAIRLRLCPVGKGKEWFFAFLRIKPATRREVKAFWQTHVLKVSTWYLEHKQDTDCVISASPDFLLRPLVDECWHLRLIATLMFPDSGRISGRNCKGEEKTSRFMKCCRNARVDNFFSDSLSDTPMAKMAEHAFLIKFKRDGRSEIRDWPDL